MICEIHSKRYLNIVINKIKKTLIYFNYNTDVLLNS